MTKKEKKEEAGIILSYVKNLSVRVGELEDSNKKLRDVLIRVRKTIFWTTFVMVVCATYFLILQVGAYIYTNGHLDLYLLMTFEGDLFLTYPDINIQLHPIVVILFGVIGVLTTWFFFRVMLKGMGKRWDQI